MSKNVLLAILIALSLIGLVDSWYLAQSAASDTSLVCDIDGLDGCNTVAQSPYSRVMGIPLADFGIAFYGLLLLASVAGYRLSSRRYFRGLLALTVAGALLSVYFVYVQLTLIQALCIYCLVSAAVSWLAFASGYLLYRRHAPASTPPA